MTRHCPVHSCDHAVPLTLLMCPMHWRMVPGPIQAAVYRAWDNGLGAGTPQHNQARRAAIIAVERKLAA